MSLMKSLQSWLAVLALSVLSACGGGGGDAGASLFTEGTGTNTGNTAAPVANVQVVFTPRQVSNSGTETVQANITVTDATGKGLADVPVAISVDKDATYSSASAVTSATGVMTATVTIGANYDTRTIVFTAKAGDVSRTFPLEVVGTSNVASDLILTLSAPELANSTNNTVNVTARAVDFNRNAKAGTPVTLQVVQPDTAVIVVSSAATASDGTVIGAVSIGTDRSVRKIRVRAVSGTVERFIDVPVVGSKLTGQSSKTILQPSEAANVAYALTDNAGSKMVGVSYSIANASGVVVASGVTDSDGAFVHSFTAPAQAGTVTFIAIAGGVSATNSFSIETAAAVPPALVDVTSASVSANPSVVAVNTPGSQTNKVIIRGLFQSASNAPVRNVRVWFDLDGNKNSIGGTLGNTAAGKLLYTDENGVVTTTYAPSARFSPKDGVTVRACWSKTDFAVPADGGACPNATPVVTTLTVISDSLSVTIGTNGTIEEGSNRLTYIKRYVVQVVDSAGKARAGVEISPSIDVLAYLKGEFVPGAVSSGGTTTPRWIRVGGGQATYPSDYPSSAPNGPTAAAGADPVVVARLPGGRLPDPSVVELTTGRFPPVVCENEDLNRNGVSEDYFDVVSGRLVKEDQNLSFNLQPGRPALDPRKADITIKAEGASVTNQDGIVFLKVEYPQSVASWVQYNILVSASGVAGTEGRANFSGELTVLAAHVNDLASTPAFVTSPYGVGGSRLYYRRDAQGNSGWICVDPN